jgi:hypothetical protein
MMESRSWDQIGGSSSAERREHLSQWSFDGVRKPDEPKWDRLCPELLRFQCADL